MDFVVQSMCNFHHSSSNKLKRPAFPAQLKNARSFLSVLSQHRQPHPQQQENYLNPGMIGNKRWNLSAQDLVFKRATDNGPLIDPSILTQKRAERSNPTK